MYTTTTTSIATMNLSCREITIINSTIGINTTDTVEEIFSKQVTCIYNGISWTTIICACVLNTLSIAMYFTRHIKRTKFNFCLLQLAISNIVQQHGFLPYIILDVREIKTPTWYIESIYCGLSSGLSVFFTGAFVTVYTICFVTINWYRIIKKPLVRKTNKKSIFAFHMVLWFIGMVLIIPNFLSFKVDYKHGFCIRNGVFRKYLLFYKATLLFTGLVLPIFIMCFVYILIIFSMCQTRNKFKSSTKKKHRLKVIRHIGILIAVFLVSWLPFGVCWTLQMTSFFSTGIKGEYEKSRLIKYSLLPCLAASILNILFHGELRAGFLDFFTFRKPVTGMSTNK